MTTVRLTTTLGAIDIELDAEKAPVTVENFLQYVKSGFYDGTIFHRVIKGFMIQGGGYTADLSRKATLDPILNEAANGLRNVKYTIAMARTNDPHSATSQFFINTVDNDFLDHTGNTAMTWGYCVFGKVTAGTEAVDAIGRVRTSRRDGMADVPVEDVVITKAEVLA